MDSEDDVTVFCGNISPNISEAILYELFTQAGPIASLSMPKRDNEHRGFAFIQFRHECAVQYAVDLFDGTELDGRKMSIRNKSRRARRPPDIFDVLGSSLEVPFGPLRNQLGMPQVFPSDSTGYPMQFQPYGNHSNYSKHERPTDFQRTPYQRYHSTDRNRSERIHVDRNRTHTDRNGGWHADRRNPHHHSGRGSNKPTHKRFT